MEATGREKSAGDLLRSSLSLVILACQARCAHKCNSGILVGLTNCFLIESESYSTRENPCLMMGVGRRREERERVLPRKRSNSCYQVEKGSRLKRKRRRCSSLNETGLYRLLCLNT